MSASFPFQENIDVFAGEKVDKEYWLKINSKDATDSSPFDFSVRFNMGVSNDKNNLKTKKEAVINSKYNEIKRLEVTDVIIPRYIPNTTIGLNFDGVSLIRDISNDAKYFLNYYPGVMQKTGTNYVKLTNYKDCVILTDISNSITFSSDTSTFRYKDYKMIDHVNIDDKLYPITNVTNNVITINNFDDTMPTSTKLIMGNYFSNLIHSTSSANVIIDTSFVTIKNFPMAMFENTYASNILRIVDGSNHNLYFNVTSYNDTSGYYNESYEGVRLKGSFVNASPVPTLGGTVNFYLFGFGTKDLIDERIFYLQLDPFIPVKNSSTDDQLDRMFGVLFPSTQSKEWLYLSGEPKESFLPRDLRKLDKITIKIYDSEGNSINDIFKNRKGLLNTNYFKNMYSTVVIKVDEIDRHLIAKKG
jgi:hypothetical protein